MNYTTTFEEPPLSNSLDQIMKRVKFLECHWQWKIYRYLERRLNTVSFQFLKTALKAEHKLTGQKSREITPSSHCRLVFPFSGFLTLFPTGHTAHLSLSPSLLFSFAVNVPVSNSSYDQTYLEIWFQHVGIQLQRKIMPLKINIRYQNQK